MHDPTAIPDPTLWIFGYGSIMWRPAFPFVERRPAAIAGWARRFWQGSTDHRGVPDAPGRVVTLVAAPGALCWGMAYRVAAEEAPAVLAALAVREQGGYATLHLEVRFQDRAPPQDALTFVAGPTNPNYLGPASPAAIAAQIAAARGPSGPNDEYVIELARALRAMQVDDPHVFEIEAALRCRSRGRD